MIRVRDLDRSLEFYVGKLGMRLMRRQEFPEGRFTLAFVGYGEEDHDTVVELTHNWGDHDYTLGTAFGHIALEVADVYAAANALY
jgi:lactoylglutathione lyase